MALMNESIATLIGCKEREIELEEATTRESYHHRYYSLISKKKNLFLFVSTIERVAVFCFTRHRTDRRLGPRPATELEPELARPGLALGPRMVVELEERTVVVALARRMEQRSLASSGMC